MPTINLSLPDSSRAFVEAQAARGGYDSAEAYVLSLVREAQKKEAAQERLEALLLAGLNSGPPIEANDEFWEEKLRRFEARPRRETGS